MIIKQEVLNMANIMKKIICAILFVLISICTNAQSFFERNKNVSLGIQFGAVDQHNHTEMGFQTLMVNTTCYGVYLDVGGWPRSHGDDVRIDEWDDEYCFAFHLGYQLPVLKWLKITPIAGYYKHESGYTDGSHWKVVNYGISNKFVAQDKLNGFDYGCNIQIDIKQFSIFGTITKNMWYAGIGFNIPTNSK